MFDPFDANPFFGAAHEGAAARHLARLELLTELTFLGLRIAQLREIASILAAGRSVVADWALVKQPIFAGLALGETDRERIARTCAIWADDLPDPDLLIYMRADARTLLDRIAGRGRQIEANLNETYLRSLCNAFDLDLANHSGQLLVVDATTLDVFDDETVAQLAARIRQTLVQGQGACCA
jgi:deoxyadenosine/deoxycytidine kinase